MPPQKHKTLTSKQEFKNVFKKPVNLLETAYDRWLERGPFYEIDLEDWNWADHDAERNIFDRDAES
ncbi:MAG TPA: hypothetical protein VK791_01820 [bacterium]|nr:hypothetical protein [bacterium]